MGATLLMTHQDVLQPALAFGDMQSVVDRQDRSARITENGVDAMEPEGMHQGVGASDTALTAPIQRIRGRGNGCQGHGCLKGSDPQD